MNVLLLLQNSLLLKDFIYFLTEREGRRKRWRETLMCEKNIDRLPLAWTPMGPNPQPRHVPGLGIELATFHFAG